MSRYDRTMTFVSMETDSFYGNYLMFEAYEYDDNPEFVERFSTCKKKFKKIIEQLSPGDRFVMGFEDMWDTEPEELYIPELLPENMLKRIKELEAEVERLKNGE